MPTTPKTSAKPTAAATRREKKAAAQRRRRAQERVAEAENFDEAVARLREAWSVAHAEPTAPQVTPPPANPTPGTDAVPSENTPEGTAAGHVTLVKSPEPEPAKPPEVASVPAPLPEVTPPAPPAPEEEPEVVIDPGDLAEIAVDAVDELATEELGDHVRLNTSKRQKLVTALKPVLVKALKSDGKTGLSPEDALFWTAAGIYGPALIQRFMESPEETKAREEAKRARHLTLRLVKQPEGAGA